MTARQQEKQVMKLSDLRQKIGHVLVDELLRKHDFTGLPLTGLLLDAANEIAEWIPSKPQYEIRKWRHKTAKE